MKQVQPRVDLDATTNRLLKLGLDHAADRLTDFVTEAVKQEVPAHAFLDQILDAELTYRDERRIRTSLRISGLPTGQTIAGFDFAFQPSIERSRIDALATCSWLRAKETLLIQGPPGVGKTHLAVALGVKAIENGFSVLFMRLDELLAAMRKDAELPPHRLRRRKYLNVALLIIDEMGFDPMTRQEASLFFRMVAYGTALVLMDGFLSHGLPWQCLVLIIGTALVLMDGFLSHGLPWQCLVLIILSLESCGALIAKL